MPRNKHQWFDEKCKQGKPTLEERAELFRQLNLPKVSERFQRALVDDIQKYLFELEQDYRESTRVIVYGLLFGTLPITQQDNDKQYSEFVRRYKKAVAEHKEKTRLSSNFE